MKVPGKDKCQECKDAEMLCSRNLRDIKNYIHNSIISMENICETSKLTRAELNQGGGATEISIESFVSQVL